MFIKYSSRGIKLLLFLFTATFQLKSNAQVLISGRVLDAETGQGIELVTVYMEGTGQNTESDSDGNFSLRVGAGYQILVCTRIGYKEYRDSLLLPEDGSQIRLTVNLVRSTNDLSVTITDQRELKSGMIVEGTEAIRLLPSASGNLESVLPHIALGARGGTGGELSSQYNVRGGNYDENLVYVNDFEIFRPQLLKSSQQEGLSFPNIDLMRDLYFSSGAYEARYGDKMSSVMDISYKRPESFGGSVSASFLGASAHLEGSSQLGATAFQKFRYLIGTRYKTNRYLLNSLDVKGEYNPEFVDIQSYLSYDISRVLQISALSNYNSSRYDFEPQTRGTALGLIDFALRLNSVFEGSESDRFRNGMGGIALSIIPERESNPLFIKLMISAYRSLEQETQDVTGYYRLSQVETDLGSDNVGEEVAVVGVGAQQLFSRNRLYNRIYNFQIKGGIELQSDNAERSHFIQWGLKYQIENMDDRLNEWERLDSAGYSLPFDESEVLLYDVLKSEVELQSAKTTGYVQDNFNFRTSNDANFRISAGMRAGYWNLNKDFIFSPRIQVLYSPSGRDDLNLKFATGIYYQTPFYRELRRPDGTINTDLRSQKSVHVLAGLSRAFDWKRISDKPFRLILEAYYKSMSDITSYDINNVRIRYSGENDAKAYAIGLDMRVNGEFVPGAESWVNLSFLRTRENIEGIEHKRYDLQTQQIIGINRVPRPTDQFMHLSVFFQDYLPRFENFKVNLNLIFGTGLPFGLPEDNLTFRNVFRYKPYRRVDMGFAYQLWKDEWHSAKPKSVFRSMKNAWISLEVFNLMGIENVSSNTWIKSVYGEQYAVPNKLTNRRINLKFRIEF